MISAPEVCFKHHVKLPRLNSQRNRTLHAGFVVLQYEPSLLAIKAEIFGVITTPHLQDLLWPVVDPGAHESMIVCRVYGVHMHM